MEDFPVLPPPIGEISEILNEAASDLPSSISIADNGSLIQTYLTYSFLCQDLVDSYDDFISWRSLRIARNFFTPIYETRSKELIGRIIVKDLTWSKAIGGNGRNSSTPHMAKDNGDTLRTISAARLSLERYNPDTKKYTTVITSDPYDIGEIPVMIGSMVDPTAGLSPYEIFQLGQCPNYPRGYFIIKGKAKFIVASQKLRLNTFRVYYDTTAASIIGTIIVNTISGTTKISLFESSIHIINISAKILGFNQYDQKNNSINVVQIFRILYDMQGKEYSVGTSVSSTLDLVLSFIRPEWRMRCRMRLNPTRILAEVATDPYSEIIHMDSQNRKGHTTSEKEKIKNDILFYLFPQAEDDNGARVVLLARITARFLEYMAGYVPPSDRNSLSQNAISIAGMEISDLYTDIFSDFAKNNVKNMTMTEFESYANRTTNISSVFSNHASALRTRIYKDFNSSFGAKWGAKNTGRKENLVETLKSESVAQMFAHLTRITKNTSTKGKQPEVRATHATHIGYLCIVDSPEGAKCGLTKHRAITCYISRERDDNVMREIISPYISDERNDTYNTIVLLNGKLLGFTQGGTLYSYLRVWRHDGTLSSYPDFYANYNDKNKDLEIFTDAGRAVRPLLIVENGSLVIEKKGLWYAPFEVLISEGAVEYIDAAEQETIHIATKVSDIPNAVLTKRQIERQVVELKTQIDNNVEERDMLEEQLIRLIAEQEYQMKLVDYTHCELHPTAVLGAAAALVVLQNHVLGTKAIYSCNMIRQAPSIYHSNICLQADNASKALMYPSPPIFETQMSKILGTDRLAPGSMVIVAFMSLSWNQEDAIIFNKASIDSGLFSYVVYWVYDITEQTYNGITTRIVPPADARAFPKLDERGIVKIGKSVVSDDVLISTEETDESTKKSRKSSVRVKLGQEGVVESVIVNNNIPGKRYVRIKLREVRKIEPGDKFSSRSANKGVVGKILPYSSMPFSKDTGLVPDVIINPLGFVTRMTVNMLIEIIASKGAAFRGEKIDGTSFNRVDVELAKRTLMQRGYTNMGTEKFISGDTFAEYEADVFTGPCYYQALRRHVKDQIQAQNRTSKRVSTHQPVRGKNAGGVTRWGEYEVNATISHGAAHVLIDVITYSSDVYNQMFCGTCGTPTYIRPNVAVEGTACARCGVVGDLRLCEMSGAHLYTGALISGLGIGMRYSLKE